MLIRNLTSLGRISQADLGSSLSYSSHTTHQLLACVGTGSKITASLQAVNSPRELTTRVKPVCTAGGLCARLRLPTFGISHPFGVGGPPNGSIYRGISIAASSRLRESLEF